MYKVTTTLDHCPEGLVESKNDTLAEHGIENLFVFDYNDYNDYQFNYLNWREALRDGRLYRSQKAQKIRERRNKNESKEFPI